MRRKSSAILAGVLVWLLLCSTALAATVDIDTGNQTVHANSNPITIDEDDDGDTVVSTTSGARYNVNGTEQDESPNVENYTIYGGSKNEDSGSTSVTVNGGTVGDVYGGGNDGNVNGNTSVVINGGTVNGDVYGGGHATANKDEKETANVTGNTTVIVTDGTVNGDVYGGGNAEATAATGLSRPKNAVATANAGDTSVGVGEDGTVNGDVYGGGKSKVTDNSLLHSASATANVGNATVTVEGQVGDVYGGGEGGDVGGSAAVTVSGGHVKSVHGGSRKGTVKGSTDVTVENATVTGNVYGGGKDGDVKGSAKVEVKNSSVSGSVYGGSRCGDVQGAAEVALRDGTVSGSIYGGCGVGDVKGTAGTSVTVSGTAISGNIYGGGYMGSALKSVITMNSGSVGTIYAGSEAAGGVGCATIQMLGGTLRSQKMYGWGGDWYLTPVGSTQISVSQLAARGYTFYLPRCINAQNAIQRSGYLQWDQVQYAGTQCDWNNLLIPYVPYRLAAPQDRTITVITNYVHATRGVVFTRMNSVTIPAGPQITVNPAAWDGEGRYRIGDMPAPQIVDYGFDGSEIVFNISVTTIHHNNDDDDEIPLTPGTEANPDIPLGVPGTGGAPLDIMNMLLLAGITLAAAARRKKS